MTFDLQQRIQARAYELWEKAGRPDGQDQEHWMEAERQIADEGWHRVPARTANLRAQVAAIASEPHLDEAEVRRL